MNDLKRISETPKLPPRPVEGHKGTFGRVLIVGGNDEMLGAPVLAGTAALRMGAGLVQIAIPRSILPAALSVTPELIGMGLGKTGAITALLAAAEKANAIVIGPGMGRSQAATDRIMRLIQLDPPKVIDADALNALASLKRWPKKQFSGQAVLTPHPGEMSRLGKLIGRTEVPTDDAGRIDIAVEASRAFGQVILLKGERTVVTDGTRIYLNSTGNSALSKAGSGDVLSGIIGTLIGQKLSGFDAAALGAHLHGRAGEIAGEKLGLRSVLARDVIDCLADAIREMDGRS